MSSITAEVRTRDRKIFDHYSKYGPQSLRKTAQATGLTKDSVARGLAALPQRNKYPESLLWETAPQWCDYRKPPAIKEYAQPEDAFDAVQSGIVAAYTRDGIGLAELAKQQEEQEQEEPLIVVGDPFSSEPYTIAVAKENQEVLALINFTLQEMKHDGTYDTIFKAWFGCESPPFPMVTDSGTPSDEISELVVSESPLVSSCGPDIPDIYEVKDGDTLFGLAARFYGSGTLYECIYDANRDIIGDEPRRLKDGMSLVIPEQKICGEPTYAYEGSQE